MFEVMVEDRFKAVHHLYNYADGCDTPHGHYFRIQVWAMESHLDPANVSVDYKLLKRKLKEITDDLNEIDVNDFEPFAGKSPSSEFIARYIYRRMKETIPQVSKTCLYNSTDQCVFYSE